jgi:cytidylate kinase
MAYRIEMFGPMGAGKTTILKQLANNRELKKKYNVLTEMQVAKQEFFEMKRKKSLLEYLAYRLICVSGLIESRIVYGHVNFNEWSSINRYHALPSLEEIWRVSVCNRRYESPDIEAELKRMSWFISAIAKCALLEVSNKAKVVLQHESLIQRGISWSFQDIHYRENLEAYYTTMPLPRLAIYVTASENTLFSRVKKRDGINSSAYQYLLKSIEVSGEVEKILQQRGCQVFKIDTDLLTGECIAALVEKISLINEETDFTTMVHDSVW